MDMNRRPTKEQIEFMAYICRQITNKIDMDKPFPQDVAVPLKMNLICDTPQVSGIIVRKD